MIKKAYLLGLGAVGSVFASIIHDVDPGGVKIIASSDRIREYDREGVYVNDKRYDFSYSDWERADKEKAPLILIAVKEHHLKDSIKCIMPYVGENTVILSLLNGIGSEQVIGKSTGMDKMLYSYVVGIDATRELRRTKYANSGKIVFGERENLTHTPRVKAVMDFFHRYGINYTVDENMIKSMWWKFMLNVAVNQVSAVLNAPYGVFAGDENARRLLVLAAKEVVFLSEKNGVNLKDEDIDTMINIICGLDSDSMTSMLQDVRAGRKTEVEIFSGEVLSLGKKLGVKTPVNEVLYSMIKVIEGF